MVDMVVNCIECGGKASVSSPTAQGLKCVHCGKDPVGTDCRLCGQRCAGSKAIWAAGNPYHPECLEGYKRRYLPAQLEFHCRDCSGAIVLTADQLLHGPSRKMSSIDMRCPHCGYPESSSGARISFGGSCAKCGLPVVVGVQRHKKLYSSRTGYRLLHNPLCGPTVEQRTLRLVVVASNGTVESDSGEPTMEQAAIFELEPLLEAARRQGSKTFEIKRIDDTDKFNFKCGKCSTYGFFSHSHGISCLSEDLRVQWRVLEGRNYKVSLQFHSLCDHSLDGSYWTIEAKG